MRGSSRRPDSRRAVVLVGCVLLAACTSGAASSGAAPSATAAPTVDGTSRSAAPPSVPSEPPAPSSTEVPPAEAALDAYLAYTDASVEALRAGSIDGVGLSRIAADDGRQHVRRRIAKNADEGVVATGDLEPSATVDDVEVSDDGTSARVTDCVLNALAQVDADDSDAVVSPATGWRQPVEVTVELRDGRWRVTDLQTPLRNVARPVEDIPDDPPYLRGPALTDRAPSCVPDQLEPEIIDAFLEYEKAVDAAMGLNPDGVAKPTLPALERTIDGDELAETRELVWQFEEAGQALAGEPDTHDPFGVSLREFDTIAIVFDCVTVGANRIVDVETGDTVRPSPEGRISLWAFELWRVDGRWRVVEQGPIEEDVMTCAPPE